jgi:hypothetical protein
MTGCSDDPGQLVRDICEYRSLSADRYVLGRSLDQRELDRLRALERKLGRLGEEHKGSGDDRRRFARLEVEIPATLLVGTCQRSVTIVNIGGGGMVIEPAHGLGPGDLTMIAIAGGYRLPLQVVWIAADRVALGLRFVTIPGHGPLTSPEEEG